MTLFSKENKLSSRTAGKAEGTRATAQSTRKSQPHGRPGRAYARGPNDARPMRHGGSVGNRVKAHSRGRQTAGKTAESVRRLTVAGRGASVSRTAGQHDDAEKAGDTRRCESGESRRATKIISDFTPPPDRGGNGSGNAKLNLRLTGRCTNKGEHHGTGSAIPR